MPRVMVVCKTDGSAGPDAQRCPNYMRDPLPMLREFYSAWLFQCPVCHNIRAVTKDQIGGTFGAGEIRDDGTKPQRYASGWTPAR